MDFESGMLRCSALMRSVECELDRGYISICPLFVAFLAPALQSRSGSVMVTKKAWEKDDARWRSTQIVMRHEWS